MKRTDIYQSVTDTIIEALEQGLSTDFELPWHGCSIVPQNARTGNYYHGINVPLLWAHQMKSAYSSGTWATYKQWQDMGAQVKKGEKGRQIVFWKSIEVEPTQDNEQREQIMFAKYSTVFNADQVEGYILPQDDFETNDIQAISAADDLIDASGADIRFDERRAYYSVTDDYINLPSPQFFKDTCGSTATQNYYSTAFHELVHWTGAEKRLNRDQKHKFASKDYAFEELVAELGAAMLCASTGVESSPRDDHAIYIQNWLKALKDDKKFIFSASSQAQKAADYLFSFTNQD